VKKDHQEDKMKKEDQEEKVKKDQREKEISIEDQEEKVMIENQEEKVKTDQEDKVMTEDQEEKNTEVTEDHQSSSLKSQLLNQEMKVLTSSPRLSALSQSETERKPELFWVMKPLSLKLSSLLMSTLKSENQLFYSELKLKSLRNTLKSKFQEKVKSIEPEDKLKKLTKKLTFQLKNGLKPTNDLCNL